MIEENLMQFGALGMFAAYLIFDRQVLLRGIQKTIQDNTQAMQTLVATIKHRLK